MIDLILEDYLVSLKEKDELDILFSDLIKLDDFKVKSVPKTGERQFGVDLLAEYNNELYMYVIKQGDLTRHTWDSNQNSVRQSIHEILDVYLKVMLPSKYKNTKKNIIFVTNGLIRDAVRPNWEGFVNEHTKDNIVIDSILLPELVESIKKHGFNEVLFGEEKKSDLRKCLYYLDESDYNISFFERLVDSYFQEIKNSKSEKQRQRLFSSLQMVLGMVNHNAIEKKRYRISINFNEYVLLSMWGNMKHEQTFESAEDTLWLNKFMKVYIEANEHFIDNLLMFSGTRNGLPFFNPIEYRLLCFEILGCLSTYGIFLNKTNVSGIKYSSEDVLNLLIMLMNNNYGFSYPVYDNDGIEISLFLLFILIERNKDEAKTVLNNYFSSIYIYIQNKKYPILERQHNIAMSVEFREIDYSERYSASFLLGVILEWSLLLGETKISKTIEESNLFKDITIQNWNCDSSEEINLYNKNLANNQGFVDILNGITQKEAKIIIMDSALIEEFEKFSFIEYSFPVIGLIISRKNRIPVLPSYWRREFIDNKNKPC